MRCSYLLVSLCRDQVQNGLRAAVELANAAAKDTSQMAHPTVAARNVFDAVAHVAIAAANRSIAASNGFLDLLLQAAGTRRYLEAAHAQAVRFHSLFEQAVWLCAAAHWLMITSRKYPRCRPLSTRR